VAHIIRTDNPHGVTAAQAGALSATGGIVSGSVNLQGSLTRIGDGMSVSSLQIDDNAFLTDGDGDPWYSGSLERIYTHAVSNAVRELCGAGVVWIGGKFVATNAAALAGNVPYASTTSALARARAPQAVTYSGTNVYTDARIGTLFRINATNTFRLHAPTGCYPGQSMLYWIKQAVGGTNTVTMTDGDFVPPVGASSVVLSVTNGCVDQFFGVWDDSINKVRIGSFMRYTQ
jgi:hypothetical protein